MNVYSYMVVRNEADRYLGEAIYSLSNQVDGLFVLDDYSKDSTLEILRKLQVPHMSNNGTSFMENESACRQRAWDAMTRTFRPQLGDWILAMDADEFLRTSVPLSQICTEAEANHDALWMHIHEMWEHGQIRVDGFWGQIEGLRLVAWKPNGIFKSDFMGGGSIPEIAKNVGKTNRAAILHHGYYRLEDRQKKYERYSQRPGRHASRHIESILATPMLANLPQMV